MVMMAMVVVMPVTVIVVMTMRMIVIVMMVVIVRVTGCLVVVRADPLDVMVVAFLGEADLVLEAEHGLAVLAHLAVHRRRALKDLQRTLPEGFDDQIVVIKVRRLDELNLGMPGGDHIGVVVDPLHQHPGEEEIGKDDDALVAEPCRVLEPRLDEREGDARISDLAPGEAEALPEQTHHLRDIGVRIGVGSAAPDHDQHRLVRRIILAHAVDRLLDAGAGGAHHLGIDAELAAVLDPQALVLRHICIEHRGDVVLDVSGGEQHARHRQDMGVALGPQRLDPVADHRRGELQKRVLDIVVRHARGELARHLGEFAARARIAAAVPAQQHACFLRHVVSDRWSWEFCSC